MREDMGPSPPAPVGNPKLQIRNPSAHHGYMVPAKRQQIPNLKIKIQNKNHAHLAPFPVGKGSRWLLPGPCLPSPPAPLPVGEGRFAAPGASPSARGETRYWGVWPNVGGRSPDWPEGQGKRVFAYIKPFPALPRLLQQLCDLQCPTIVHGEGANANLRQRFQSATMRFEDEPLDMAETARTCDLAILNGNHGTTVSMLLADKPVLQLPTALEQGLFSLAVARLGAAVVAMPSQPAEAVGGLMEMLGSDKYAAAARQFAARYAGYDPQRQIAAVVDRAEELIRSA